jgi:ankyrin repeat protein
LDVVDRLLDAGADVNAIAYRGGETALQLASTKGYLDIVRSLLGAGADMNAMSESWRDSDIPAAGSSSLCQAQRNGHVHVANLLRALGAKEREQLVKEGADDID